VHVCSQSTPIGLRVQPMPSLMVLPGQVSHTSERLLEGSELFTGPNRDFLARQRVYGRLSRREKVGQFVLRSI
jgi:hypothetical protein